MKPFYFLLSLLLCVNLSFAQDLTLLSEFSFNACFDVAAINNQVYLSDGRVLSIDDPSNPQVLSTSLDYRHFITDFHHCGDYLYYGTGMAVEFGIVDVSEPGYPQIISRFDYPDNPSGIFGIDGNDDLLVLAGGQAGLLVVDVKDKTNPKIRDSYQVESQGGLNQIRDVAVNGNIVYAAHQKSVLIFDISNPDAIELLKIMDDHFNPVIDHYYAESIEYDPENELLILAKSRSGFQVFDVQDPLDPILVYELLEDGTQSSKVELNCGHLYFLRETQLQVFEMNQAENFPEVLKYDATEGGQSFDIAFHENLVLLPNGITGLSILQKSEDLICNWQTSCPEIPEAEVDTMETDTLTSIGSIIPFEIYTNRISSQLEITNAEINTELQIFNSYGKVIKQVELLEINTIISVQDLYAGTYFCRITKGKKRSKTLRFVKL